MSDKANTVNTGSKKDGLLWAIVAVFVAGGIYGYNYFAAESTLYRVIGIVVLAAIACWIAAQTAKGKAFITLGMEARTEIRKVVWPSRQETTHTTMIVVVVVLIVALMLWGMDSLLSLLIKMVIG